MPDDDATLAREAVDEGARRYFAERRARIVPFVDAHFSVRGSLRLHRAAVGWDVARAPLNLLLAGPQLLLHLLARAAGPRLRRLLRRDLLLRTAVSRELEWLIITELLELPFRQGDRASDRDALTEAIVQAPALQDRLEAAGGHGADPAFRSRLAAAVGEYGITRAAAAEIATGLVNLGAGGLVLHKVTPGAATFGPALAGTLAQQAAVGAFPLGGWLGGLWYGWFPVSASAGLTAGATIGLALLSTVFAAFAGVLSDPIQRALGLHRARLRRMVDALERQFLDPRAAGFAVHDHYVARLLDVMDYAGIASRMVRF